MTDDAREINQQAYDHIAEWYLHWATSQSSPRQRYTEKVLHNAASPKHNQRQNDISTPHPNILELGCGPGLPITKYLLDAGATVTANDISATQTRMAHERCPTATFLTGDMSALSFPPATFDGVTCFYALFHLPRDDQKALLRRLHAWLRPGGMLVFNSATVDAAEIHGEMMGQGMFWSSFDVAGNVAMVREAGFERVEYEVLEAGEGLLEEDDPDYGVEFLWVAAWKEGVCGEGG